MLMKVIEDARSFSCNVQIVFEDTPMFPRTFDSFKITFTINYNLSISRSFGYKSSNKPVCRFLQSGNKIGSFIYINKCFVKGIILLILITKLRQKALQSKRPTSSSSSPTCRLCVMHEMYAVCTFRAMNEQQNQLSLFSLFQQI